jgi:peroxiredoxin
MKVLYACAIAMMAVALPAAAALGPGTPAPDFTTQASLGGNEFTFSLKEALGKGPVVIYFYPAAFTKGCTIVAHAFADAMDDFKALGATVIGVSEDNIETLNRFSVSACQSKFPVAADNGGIAKAYDAIMENRPDRASRTSYVITPDDKVIYSYTDMNPDKHVENTLGAIRQWRSVNPTKPAG